MLADYKVICFPFSQIAPKSEEKGKIKEAEEFFNILFDEDIRDKFTRYNVCNLLNNDFYNTSDNTYFYTKSQLMKEIPYLIGGNNIYFTYNGFKKNKRKAEEVNKIHCIAFDIDFKEQELNHLEILEILKNDIPIKPTYIINSGNGYHVYYKIESYKNSYSYTEKYYNRVYNSFMEYLKTFNIIVDINAHRPINRVLRVPYTMNYKPNRGEPKEVIIEYKNTDSIYKLGDIAEATEGIYTELLEEEIKKKVILFPQKKKGLEGQITANKSTSNIKSDKTLLSMLEGRREDYKNLIMLRGRKLTGLRHSYFFYYIMNEIRIDEVKTGYRKELSYYKELLRKVNNSLIEPQNEADLMNSLYYILENYIDNKEGFNTIRNSTIIKSLNITEQEQKELNVIIGEKERKKRKDNRNREYYQEKKEDIKKKYISKLKKEGKKTKAEELEEVRKKALSLRSEGLSIRKIADILNMNKDKISRLLKI